VRACAFAERVASLFLSNHTNWTLGNSPEPAEANSLRNPWEWKRKEVRVASRFHLQLWIELISHTTTEEGLTVTAIKDTHSPTGIKVSDDEMAALNLLRDPFHGEWNYTIQPE
jgi:DDE family transposase